MKNIIKEFQQFIKRGNVIDLAVAVIMGNAFSEIINSLVNHIFMPLIGIIVGGINFTELHFTIKDATVYYGIFLQNIINFLIIAICIFLVVKLMNKFFIKKEEVKEEVVKSDEVKLLEEIRDLLKKSK